MFQPPQPSSSPALCGIAVMAKASRPGRTKTRLCPPLTPGQASDFNTAFLQDIAQNLGSATEHASIDGYVAYGPPGEGAFFDFLPPRIHRFEAWCSGFGETLLMAICYLLDVGHVAAGVLNSDSPTLPPSFLAEAAGVLAEPGDRAVLGPATDGGYYFLGLKKPHARLFEDIDWSTAQVARQTLERAAEINLPVHMLPEWYDVDDAESLDRVRLESSTIAAPALNTRALLSRIEEEALLCPVGKGTPPRAPHA